MGRGQDVSAIPCFSTCGPFVEGLQGEGLGCVFCGGRFPFSMSRAKASKIQNKTLLAFVQCSFYIYCLLGLWNLLGFLPLKDS